MTKAYWVSLHKDVSDADKWNAYADKVIPVVKELGGALLTRGPTAHASDAGVEDRTLVIEFPSLEAALAAFNSSGYQAGLKVLGDNARPDLRIVEGLPIIENPAEYGDHLC